MSSLKQLLFLLLFIFILCLHPLQKTLALLVFVLAIIMELSTSASHWVCYLFALIYFGGVLILFTYISSVVPNFSPSSSIIILPLMLSLLLPFISPQNLWSFLENFNSTETPLSFIASSSSFFILYFILSLVLMLLILSISILSDFKSPLRNV